MTHYLTTGDILAIADEVGAAELRDFGLLDSGVARPQSAIFGREAYPDLWEKAAALMHSLITSHPFVDGNKRTALVATLAFLDLNGVACEPLDEEAAYELTVGIAAGKWSDVRAIAVELYELART